MISLRQMLAQSENLDFLGALRTRTQQTEIVELPALRSPAIEHRVGQSGEVRLAEEGRNHRSDQQDHQPWRENYEPGRKRYQAQRILSDVQNRSQQADPPGGLSPGPL